jgi:SAM-dependent methyltransferase
MSHTGQVNQTPDTTESSTAAQFWDGRYGERDQIWSGRPNQVLVELTADLVPGRALDLGAGEGADSIWLAERGWQVTALDVSATAIDRARAAAGARGLAVGQIDWQVTDLATWSAAQDYQLVSAFFLHSPVDFPRARVLRRAADTVSAGGHLLVVGHAAPPPWARDHDGHHMELPTPASELADLALDAGAWEILVAGVRERDATGPDGQAGHLSDSVVFARRR